MSKLVSCEACDSTGWVCEGHQDQPWQGPRACGCGGAGAPCKRCNDMEPPRVADMIQEIDADADGPR